MVTGMALMRGGTARVKALRVGTAGAGDVTGCAAARRNSRTQRVSLARERNHAIGQRTSVSVGSKASVANVADLGVVDCEMSDGSRDATTCKYKLKTRKATIKRFKVTGNGKVVRRKQGKQHLNTKKSSKRKRSLSQPAVVKDADIAHIKGSLPNHKVD